MMQGLESARRRSKHRRSGHVASGAAVRLSSSFSCTRVTLSPCQSRAICVRSAGLHGHVITAGGVSPGD